MRPYFADVVISQIAVRVEVTLYFKGYHQDKPRQRDLPLEQI